MIDRKYNDLEIDLLVNGLYLNEWAKDPEVEIKVLEESICRNCIIDDIEIVRGNIENLIDEGLLERGVDEGEGVIIVTEEGNKVIQSLL